MIHRIATAEGVAAPVGPFSQVVVANGFAFTAGQLPTLPDGSTPDDFEAQVDATIDNLERLLVAAGSGLDRVVSMRGFLVDPAHLEPYNRVCARRFAGALPARTTVGVELWGVSLEIDCIAAVDQADTESSHA